MGRRERWRRLHHYGQIGLIEMHYKKWAFGIEGPFFSALSASPYLLFIGHRKKGPVGPLSQLTNFRDLYSADFILIRFGDFIKRPIG